VPLALAAVLRVAEARSPDLLRHAWPPSAARSPRRHPREPAVEFTMSSMLSRCDPRGKWGTLAPCPQHAAARHPAPPVAAGRSPLPARAQHQGRQIPSRHPRSIRGPVNRCVPVIPPPPVPAYDPGRWIAIQLIGSVPCRSDPLVLAVLLKKALYFLRFATRSFHRIGFLTNRSCFLCFTQEVSFSLHFSP
jgi:hypothetical protein